MKYIITFLLLLIQCTTFAAIPTQKKFIVIADIHFNPFIGCEQLPTPCPIITELETTPPQSWDNVFQKYQSTIKTRFRQDTDYLLLQSTLTKLHQLTQNQSPTFILLSGDFIAHGFPEKFKQYTHNESTTDYQAFTKKTFEYLTEKLNKSAPTISLYPVIGNNDSYAGNYNLEPQSSFLTDTTTIFSSLIKNENALKEFKQSYPYGGYYAISLNPHENQRLIVLNSVLFSTLHGTRTQKIAANEELAWLEQQLQLAKQNKQHVIIALHIPVGVDVFLSEKMQINLVRSLIHPLFFSPTYHKKFLSLLNTYADNIEALLPAHTHHNNFQLIPTSKKDHVIPSIITASISPIYNNKPTFNVFTYNDNLAITNYDAYVYTLEKNNSQKWEKEYNFNKTYQPNCTQCTMVNGILNLKHEPSLINPYEKYFDESRSNHPKKSAIMNYWCAIDNIDWKPYQACVSSINR